MFRGGELLIINEETLSLSKLMSALKLSRKSMHHRFPYNFKWCGHKKFRINHKVTFLSNHESDWLLNAISGSTLQHIEKQWGFIDFTTMESGTLYQLAVVQTMIFTLPLDIIFFLLIFLAFYFLAGILLVSLL